MKRNWLLALCVASQSAAAQTPDAVTGTVLRGRFPVAGALVQFIPVDQATIRLVGDQSRPILSQLIPTGGSAEFECRGDVLLGEDANRRIHHNFSPAVIDVLPANTC